MEIFATALFLTREQKNLRQQDKKGWLYEPESGQTKTCTFEAQFSGVGPHQATGIGALGFPPPDNSVAINPSIFGLPYGTISQRSATQRQIIANVPNIVISAPGLPGYPGGTTFTIGDVGDSNIRNSVTPRFDIYRFGSNADALAFGKRTAQTTVTGVPNSWSCPE